MDNFKYILDSDSDEELGWSKTKDLPRSRQSVLLEKTVDEARKRKAEATNEGPEAKKAKESPREEVLSEEASRLNIINWPEKLINHLIPFISVDNRVKLRATCKKFKDLLDNWPKAITQEIDLRRIGETELGLFLVVNDREGQFVIANKNIRWVEQPLKRTLREMRRGFVQWTPHHKNRMGRIRTALRSILDRSHLYKLNISQVNLSNSFMRDIKRVLTNRHLFSFHIEAQMWDAERPDLHLLSKLPTSGMSLAIRVKEREPLPQLDRFLREARDNYAQIVVEIRQDSWKFHSSMSFRNSYEDYGISNSFLVNLVAGKALNHLRFKFVCRNVSQEGVINIIKYLRKSAKTVGSRGFCIVMHATATAKIMEAVKKLPEFGTPVESEPLDRYSTCDRHETTDEYLELRPIRVVADKTKLIEVRYWRKGDDSKVPYFHRRYDDYCKHDPFEMPRWKKRPA